MMSSLAPESLVGESPSKKSVTMVNMKAEVNSVEEKDQEHDQIQDIENNGEVEEEDENSTVVMQAQV